MLADRVCGLIIAGAAAGVVDYTTFDGSRRFYQKELMLLRAFAQQRAIRSSELRLAFRSAAQRDDDAAEAVNEAIRNNEPWLYGAAAAAEDQFEDTRVAWFRVFGNLGAARKA